MDWIRLQLSFQLSRNFAVLVALLRDLFVINIFKKLILVLVREFFPLSNGSPHESSVEQLVVAVLYTLELGLRGLKLFLPSVVLLCALF